MNWMGFGRKQLWPNFKVLSLHHLEGLKETTNIAVRIAGLRPRFEPRSSGIQSRSVNHSTMIFGSCGGEQVALNILLQFLCNIRFCLRRTAQYFAHSCFGMHSRMSYTVSPFSMCKQ
jgi:hypothetical protein